MNFYGNLIRSRLYHIRHIKTRSGPTPRTVSDKLPIHPNIKSTIHSFKTQVNYLICHRIIVKCSLIQPRWIFGRNNRWTHRERIRNICIMRLTIAIQLPMRRHLHLIPRRSIIIHLIKRVMPRFWILTVEKLPLATKRLNSWSPRCQLYLIFFNKKRFF